MVAVVGCGRLAVVGRCPLLAAAALSHGKLQ